MMELCFGSQSQALSKTTSAAETIGAELWYQISPNPSRFDDHCVEIMSDRIKVNFDNNLILNDNRCEENGNSGIIFIGSTWFDENCKDGINIEGVPSGTAMNNICRFNKLDGIQIKNNAKPILTGNHCEENENSGISLRDFATGNVENNTCSRNKTGGICVYDQSIVNLIGNRCQENGQQGIEFSDFTNGTLEGNRCFNNLGMNIHVDPNASVEFKAI